MQTSGILYRHEGTEFKGVNDEWDKFNDFQHYDEFSIGWLKECWRILKPNGTICVIGSFHNIYRLGYHIQNLDFWILNDIVWNKTNPVPNFAGTRFCNSHETMIWAAKSKNSKPTFNYKTMKYLNNNKQEKSVWNIPLCTGNERLKDENGTKLHNTQKPEQLLYKIILAATKPNDIVLDPFFGTGTTGAVAKLLNRNWIGIEKDINYINPALERINKVKTLNNEITNLELETKPPKVHLKKLIEKNYLKPSQTLFDKNKTPICVILDNGNVKDDEELSIHKMSAKYLNKKNHNGWEYFWCEFNNQFMPINDLRYLYAKEHNV